MIKRMAGTGEKTGERGEEIQISPHIKVRIIFECLCLRHLSHLLQLFLRTRPYFQEFAWLRTAEKLCWQHVGFDPLLSLPRLSSPHETLNKHALAHSEWLTSWVKGWCLYSFHFPFTKYWPNKQPKLSIFKIFFLWIFSVWGFKLLTSTERLRLSNVNRV